MHDSGKRQSFATGAVRDAAEKKPRPDLFSPFAEERVGEWLRAGAVKYSERNWEQGIPASRCFASLRRHVMQYHQGDRSEDHLAAVIFNAMAIIHYEEMIRRGVLPAELDDMPTYQADLVPAEAACDVPAPVSEGVPEWERKAFDCGSCGRHFSLQYHPDYAQEPQCPFCGNRLPEET